jgi:hypothetical protein
MSTRFLSGLVLLTACSLLSLPAMAGSQARIVRLSDVHGSVQINKNSGLGFEHAFLNLPITQGTELKTLSDGRAEVEFEDGSSLRVAPNSLVRFSTLGLSDTGVRNSVVDLPEGLAYVNWLGKDEISLKFSKETASLDHAAHFRVMNASDEASLAVFKGEVEVDGPAGRVTLAKNKTASFDPADNDKSEVASKIKEIPSDSWDKDATSYHDDYAKVKNDSSPYGYGLSDLNYYGAFTNVAGYGMMWQPFFTGVGWDPFMDGAWGWYPGMGYMFASAYPWGWLPYRYGNWMFVPAMGWMWQPGGWNSWLAVPSYTATSLSPVHLTAPTGSVNTVVVGRGGATSTLASSSMRLVSGTAGLGVPRGSFENLRNLNREVVSKGFAEMHPMPQFAVQTQRRVGYGGGMHEGMPGYSYGPASSAPASVSSSSSSHASAGAAAGGRR